MKKKLIVLGLVAMLALGITYAYARGPGDGPGWRGEECWGYQGAGKGSPLTPEQETKFQELRQKFLQETAQLRGAIVTKRQELHSLWIDPKADPKVIAEKEKELRDLQDQMRDKVVESKLEARKILTPEQLSEFGSGPRIGRGYWGGHRRGYGPGYGRGYGMGPGSERGPGYGPCY
jgi:Spy/CpxP family protein refolding chaperone